MLKIILNTSLCVMFIFWVGVVSAQETDVDTETTANIMDEKETSYQVYALPKGERVQYENELHMCYNFALFKELLTLDNRLRLAEELVPKLHQQAIYYKLALSEEAKALSESNKQIEILQRDRERLFQRWSQENRKRHKAENKSIFGNWIPWMIAGGVVMLSGGIVVGMAVSD